MMVLLAIWLPRTGRDWPYFNTVTSLGKIYIIQDDILHEKMFCAVAQMLAGSLVNV
jgi:hypothetical protein